MIHKRNSTFTQENVSAFPSELPEKIPLTNFLVRKYLVGEGEREIVIGKSQNILVKEWNGFFFIDNVVLNIRIVEKFGLFLFFCGNIATLEAEEPVEMERDFFTT